MAYTTIDNPFKHFNTKLTTGTGSSQAVTGVGFQPDWIWGKRRDSTGHNSLFDSVRGITKGLESNQTNAEFTSTDYYSSFDSDGFTIAAGSGGAGNGSSQTAVQWCWKAGGAASSNSNGSITSSVSVNTTAGFSVCSWTGNSGTIGHGLGVKPDMIIIKSRQTSNNWVVLHNSLTGGMDTNGIVLNDTAAETSGGSGMAEPTSSVFTITGGLAANDNNIGYVFASIKGYSKFGKYTGNGNAEGPFVYTGFRPAFVFLKQINGADSWYIYDNKANPSNPNAQYLRPNLNAAEGTFTTLDTLSNGFKFRTDDNDFNGSSDTYLYWAIAEAPFVTAGTKAAGTAR